jgi:hypothetical protein
MQLHLLCRYIYYILAYYISYNKEHPYCYY